MTTTFDKINQTLDADMNEKKAEVQWKLVPVEPTDEMLSAVVKSTSPTLREECFKMVRADYIGMVAVAPGPPAGDVEVELWQYWPASNRPHPEYTTNEKLALASDPDAVALVDRAHVTRLTADAVRSEAHRNELFDKIVDQRTTIGALTAERDRHAHNSKEWESASLHWMAEYDKAKSELTRARELLKSGSSPTYSHCAGVMEFLGQENKK